MGTSRSYGGPGDSTPLLPSWALNPEQPPLTPNDIPSEPQDDGEPEDGGETGQAAPQTPVAVPAQPIQRWRSARTAFRKAVESSSRDNWRTAARRYVSARGGSRTAAGTSTAGRRATAGVASFLGDVRSRGLNETLRRFGLDRVIGADALTVVTAVANAISPSGGAADDAVARQSTMEVLAWLYDKYATSGDGLLRLEQLDEAEVAETITESVTRYIFNRWLEELGKKIEEKAISADQAVTIERDILDFIRESVKLDFSDQPLLTLDWQSNSAAQLIEKIYGDAYRMLE